MKREVILKVESEKGKEEYPIEVKDTELWDDILFGLFNVDNLLTNKAKKEILLKTSDSGLIRWIFSTLTGNLNYQELETVYQKIKEDPDAQMSMLAYCWSKKKVRMIRKLASEGINQAVRYEAASYFI